MTHLDTELKQLKADILEMWNIVLTQLYKARESILRFDKDLVSDITANEKRVDAFELKLNMDCENILALFNPLANDLRFVLAVLKITYNLERIGDYAHGISKLVQETDSPFNDDSLEVTKIVPMFHIAMEMLQDAYESFEQEDNIKVRSIFNKDLKLDHVNKNANSIISELIKAKPEETVKNLNLLSIIRKLERVGDQTKNIAEEIIFYMEAKIVKHKKKKN